MQIGLAIFHLGRANRPLQNPGATANEGPLQSSLYDRAVPIILLLFGIFNVCTGPLRWTLSIAKLTPVIYLPNAAMLVGIIWGVTHAWRWQGVSRIEVVAWVMMVFGLMLGCIYTNPVQAAFGLYVMLPFVFGLICSPQCLSAAPKMRRAVTWLWLISVLGVLVNVFVTYPWEGFEYEVAGQSVETSREWVTSGGMKRISGFARASFDAAIQIQVLAIMLLILRKKRDWINFLIWVISAVGIAVTTSKGIFNVFFILTPIVLLKDKLPEGFLAYWPVSLGLIGLYLPLSTLFYTYTSQINDPFWANITFSFYDRLNNMWPEAWRLIEHRGNLILGRGFGGIGAAQTYFEPLIYNAGDNLFMYGFVILGWFLLPIYLIYFATSCWLKPWTRKHDDIIYSLCLAVLTYGITANVVENAFFAFCAGVVIRALTTRCREICSPSTT